MPRPRRNPSQRSLAVSVHLQSYNTRSKLFPSFNLSSLAYCPWRGAESCSYSESSTGLWARCDFLISAAVLQEAQWVLPLVSARETGPSWMNIKSVEVLRRCLRVHFPSAACTTDTLYWLEVWDDPAIIRRINFPRVKVLSRNRQLFTCLHPESWSVIRSCRLKDKPIAQFPVRHVHKFLYFLLLLVPHQEQRSS